MLIISFSYKIPSLFSRLHEILLCAARVYDCVFARTSSKAKILADSDPDCISTSESVRAALATVFLWTTVRAK